MMVDKFFDQVKHSIYYISENDERLMVQRK